MLWTRLNLAVLENIWEITVGAKGPTEAEFLEREVIHPLLATLDVKEGSTWVSRNGANIRLHGNSIETLAPFLEAIQGAPLQVV